MERTALISICLLSSFRPFQGYVFISLAPHQITCNHLPTPELSPNLCQTYSISPKLPIKKNLNEANQPFITQKSQITMPSNSRSALGRQVNKMEYSSTLLSHLLLFFVRNAETNQYKYYICGTFTCLY